MKSSLQEELGRISKLMSINEAPPRKKPKPDVGSVGKVTAKKAASEIEANVQASIEKTAKKKKPTGPEPIKPKNLEDASNINKKKKIALNDTEVIDTLETVLGPTLSKKARVEFEGLSDETILKYIKSIEAGKFNRLPEVIQEKLNKIYKKDPTWLERWKKRTKEMSAKQQAVFWGVVLFGSVYVLGVISERGITGLISIMKKPIDLVFGLGQSAVESDWKSYVKDLDNYKVVDANNVFIGTLKDVLKPNQTIQNPFYGEIQNKVDSWINEHEDEYSNTTMYMAMDEVLKYIISDIDTEYNSSYWISPMNETDPMRPNLKNKTQEYWDKLRTSVNDAKSKIK